MQTQEFATGNKLALSTTSMPIPAGSPRLITNRWLASNDEVMVVLRLLLLGLLLLGLATGVRQQWLQIHWDRLLNDLGAGGFGDDEPFDFNQWLIGDPEPPPAAD